MATPKKTTDKTQTVDPETIKQAVARDRAELLEKARLALLAEQKENMDACLVEINEVLERRGAQLVPVISIVGTQINTSVEIMPRKRES